jgi:preprotein translocase subunit YajC
MRHLQRIALAAIGRQIHPCERSVLMGFPFHLAQQINVPGATAPANTGPGPAQAGNPVAIAPAATGNTTTSTESKTRPASESQPAPKGALEQFLSSGFPLVILVMVLLYFFMLRGPRKEEKARKAAMAALKKGDEVLLISGKYGTIVDIRDDYVVIKVDETNNVKEKYVKNAIQKVIPSESETKKS